MLVNLTQYRVKVGTFNNRQIIISLHYEGSLYLGMSNNLSNYGSSYFLLMFYFFFYVLFLSKGNVLKITTNIITQHCCARPSMSLKPFINVKW